MPTRPDDVRRPAPPAAVAGAGAVAVAGLYLVNPNTSHIPLCPLHAVTGLNCPLCGSTRAAYALLHGQLGTALHDNLLVVGGLPLLMLLWWRWHQAESARMPRWLTGVAVAVAVIFGVLRNLPIGSALAPPG